MRVQRARAAESRVVSSLSNGPLRARSKDRKELQRLVKTCCTVCQLGALYLHYTGLSIP